MTDTKSEQSTNPRNQAQPLATGLHLLVLLPILGLLLLLALWATVFHLLSEGRSEATVYLRSGLAGSVLVVAFITLLMFQAHRLRKSALAAGEFQAILMDTRDDHAFLQSLIDHLPVLVYVRDMRPETQGRMIVWNKTAEVVTGYPIEGVLGKIDRTVFPQETVAMFEQFEHRMRDKPMVIDLPEIAFQRPDGGLRFMHVITVPLFDDKNRLEYMLGIAEYHQPPTTRT